jgi:hypothetical protein
VQARDVFAKGTAKCAGDVALWMEWALFEMRCGDVPRARIIFQVVSKDIKRTVNLQ